MIDASDPLAPFLALARHALGPDGDPAWATPLARLLAAAAAGHGSLPLDACCPGLDPADRPAALIAIDGDRALLPRTAAAWATVRAAVERAWATPPAPRDEAVLRAGLDRLLPPTTQHDADGRVVFDNVHQRLAVAALVDVRAGVLTGGPGTGKTTSAAALLALRAWLEPDLAAEDVLVCAPTGKAANRLRRALAAAALRLDLHPRERELLLALRPLTVHRALEWTPLPPEDGGPFRRGPRRPLAARLVLVDEASMADVELMAHLVRAVRDDAALLLLGDRDQLESVEAGGVLAELVARGASGGLDPARAQRLTGRIGADATATWRAALGDPAAEVGQRAPLPGLAVGLGWSYRARSAPWVLELAALVRPGAGGDAAGVAACCAAHADERLRRFGGREALYRDCDRRWRELATAAAGWRAERPPADDALVAALDAFQLLVATNLQVAEANRRGTALLADGDHIALPHATPIAIEAGDRGLDLANGDLGLALGPGPGRAATVACFPGLDAPLPLARLPRHRAAFGLTIHKSQGSEWNAVAIDLPDGADDLLDRHLLYTAVTRSAGWIGLHASDAVLERVLDAGIR